MKKKPIAKQIIDDVKLMKKWSESLIQPALSRKLREVIGMRSNYKVAVQIDINPVTLQRFLTGGDSPGQERSTLAICRLFEDFYG